MLQNSYKKDYLKNWKHRKKEQLIYKTERQKIVLFVLIFRERATPQ